MTIVGLDETGRRFKLDSYARLIDRLLSRSSIWRES
jgi:hypothetical protein